MTLLEFTPTAGWKSLHKRLVSEATNIPSCKKVDFIAVANDLYLDKITLPSERLETWLSQATETQAEQFVALYQLFWNQTPRKALDGRTPNQEAARHKSSRKKGQTHDEWTKIASLLLTIQGNFQAELYEALDNYPQKQWKPIINNIHRLFERYYHTVIGEFLPDQTVAPADMVDTAITAHNVILPGTDQIIVRLFRSPDTHSDVHKQVRMLVAQESLERAPLMLDLLAQRTKSETFPHDYDYNQCLKHLQEYAGGNELPIIAKELWRYCALSWRAHNQVLAKAFNKPEWLELWQQYFTKAATDWQTTDEVFEIIVRRIHEQVAPMDAAAQQLQAPEDHFIQPLDRSEFLQYMTLFDIQTSFGRLFLSPLITYLPLLETRYVEPMLLTEELDDFVNSGVGFVIKTSKPPSYFKLRNPVASKLWQELGTLD